MMTQANRNDAQSLEELMRIDGERNLTPDPDRFIQGQGFPESRKLEHALNPVKDDLEALFARMPCCERDAVFEQKIQDYISKAGKPGRHE